MQAVGTQKLCIYGCDEMSDWRKIIYSLVRIAENWTRRNSTAFASCKIQYPNL